MVSPLYFGEQDENGEIVELHCTYDPETKGGNAPDGRRVKATLHWVSVDHAVKAEARLYDYLFTVEEPDSDSDKDFTEFLNPDSMVVVDPVYIEPSVKGAEPGTLYQFERLAYFAVDPDSTDEKLVFNRTVTLRDQWKKVQKRNQ